MLMDWLKKVPNSVIITLILSGVGVVMVILVGFIYLAATGQPTDDYRAFVNTLMNIIALPLAATGALGGVAAARSSSRTEEQTNGVLTGKDAEIAELREKVMKLGGRP